MVANGPIIILEDDSDDQEVLIEVFHNLEIINELKFFDNSKEVLSYLRTTTEQPFLILTDVNLPGMNGIELRKEIIKDEQLRRKNIPFVILTTSANRNLVQEAYDMQIQGYFQKGVSFAAVQSMIKTIIDYWKLSKHTNG